MAKYDVRAFCDHCSETHPMGITVNLNDGPAEQASIGDVYQGKELPPGVGRLVRNTIVCPKTGRDFLQQDNHQIFLVPLS